MPIKSLNSIFRGSTRFESESGPSTKRLSKDLVKRNSLSVAHAVVAPLTPPISPFYQGFQGQTIDLTYSVPSSPCVTISGPLPDHVFAMIVSQQQQQQIFRQKHQYHSLDSANDHSQLSSNHPSRSSSLAPSLASLTSSSSTTASFSGPATPTLEIPNPLDSRIPENNKSGNAALPRFKEANPTSRPRNSRAGSRESMTERGVSWGTKRSLSDRTLCLEKREADDVDDTGEERVAFATELKGALAAESRAAKNPGFRLSGIPLRASSSIGMSRSRSLGNLPSVPSSGMPDREMLPHHGVSNALRPPPARALTRYLNDKPLPKPTVSPKSRTFTPSAIESSILSPPLSAVGDLRKPFQDGRKSPIGTGSGIQRRSSTVTSAASESSRPQTLTAVRRDSRRSTFGRSMVSPISTNSPRLSRNLAISPRMSIQQPITPPPDIPLPPVPKDGPASLSPKASRRFSQLPMPSRLSPTISNRPGLHSRHSAASRLPTSTLKHQRSSPELGSSSWNRVSRRPPTPFATVPELESPKFTQFHRMESSSSLLTDEPFLPGFELPVSPTFDAIGAMLEEDEARSSSLLDTEPPWMDRSPSLHQVSSMLPRSPRLATFSEPESRTLAASSTVQYSGTWGPRQAEYATMAPTMKRQESTGLEGIKLLLAQENDWTQVHSSGRIPLQDPFNARTECIINSEMMADDDGYVVWGTAL